jgi:hypothetical protein
MINSRFLDTQSSRDAFVELIEFFEFIEFIEFFEFIGFFGFIRFIGSAATAFSLVPFSFSL